jgi:hypothetical protein
MSETASSEPGPTVFRNSLAELSTPTLVSGATAPDPLLLTWLGSKLSEANRAALSARAKSLIRSIRSDERIYAVKTGTGQELAKPEQAWKSGGPER